MQGGLGGPGQAGGGLAVGGCPDRRPGCFLSSPPYQGPLQGCPGLLSHRQHGLWLDSSLQARGGGGGVGGGHRVTRVKRGYSSCSKCLETGGVDGDMVQTRVTPRPRPEQAAP